MWQNIKYYLLAYAVMATGSLVSTALQLLAAEFPTGHPVSTLAANLSGVTVGGLIMVMAFFKDQRVEEERKRVDAERERVKEEQARTKAEQERADIERSRADRERERADEARAHADAAQERADYAITELNRLRSEYETVAQALIKRLEELNNGQPGPPNIDR